MLPQMLRMRHNNRNAVIQRKSLIAPQAKIDFLILLQNKLSLNLPSVFHSKNLPLLQILFGSHYLKFLHIVYAHCLDICRNTPLKSKLGTQTLIPQLSACMMIPLAMTLFFFKYKHMKI